MRYPFFLNNTLKFFKIKKYNSLHDFCLKSFKDMIFVKLKHGVGWIYGGWLVDSVNESNLIFSKQIKKI